MTLVVGCGNPLRRDDGLGPRLAREAGWWGLPGVRVLVVQGWLPELATELAAADRVLLLDAEDRCGTPQWTTPGPAATDRTGWHRQGPETLLALAQELCGRLPEVRVLSLPGRDFGCGEDCSPTGQRTLQTARGMLRRALTMTPASADAAERP